MSVELNHTIVCATDREKSAEFLAGILGLRTEPVVGPFVPVRLANGVAYWADPFHERPGAVNTLNGGRGIYFEDPDGHNLELLTRG